MPEQSVRPLLAALEAAGRLARVARRVDPAREIAAVGAKAWRDLAKGVVFDDAAGWRCVTHILVDRGQWAAALGVPAAGLLPFVQAALRRGTRPATVGDGPVAALPVARGAPDIENLPLPRAGASDAAAQMVAVAIAVDPESGQDCIGLTRHQHAGAGRLSVIGMSPALDTLHRRWRAHGKPMPLALAVGADPALYLAAALGTWRAADLALAGSLARAPIRVLRDDAVGVPVPADAELAIAGTLSATETIASGSLLTPFGTPSEGGDHPVLEVGHMLRRADPVFCALHTGTPGDLSGALCLAAAALVAEHIRNIEGGIDVIDVVCPPAAGAQVVVIKLRARVEGQAKTALMGALSGPANWLKLAIAVDEDVDAADLRDVFWSVASRTHAETDVGMIDAMRAHPLDFAALPAGDGRSRVGTRWFIDSTMPPLSQGQRRDDFARAIPKNLDLTDLASFLPKG